MRLIQVGLGGFGRSWATLAHTAGGIQLVAVADADPAAQAWARSELDLPPAAIHASLDAALSRVDAEAVLVVTPPETHHGVAGAAMDAGKHVLIEKPLATTLADARALVEIAATAGRTLMVSQNYRFRRPARAVQRLVADGVIGDLTAVTVHCHRDTRALWPADNFRYSMRHPYVLDMSIHHADLLRAVTGREVRQLFARGWRVPDSPYQHDPAVIAVMALDNGATVTYEGSWATHDRETSWNGDWELVGERGRIRWTGGETDPTTGDVTLERWGEPPQPVAQPPLTDNDRQGTLHAFRAAVETGAEPETSARDNINSLAIILACVASIEREQAVAIAKESA
jgi:predicted dehydrogenase